VIVVDITKASVTAPTALPDCIKIIITTTRKIAKTVQRVGVRRHKAPLAAKDVLQAIMLPALGCNLVSSVHKDTWLLAATLHRAPLAK
jgi:hypothetical protein